MFYTTRIKKFYRYLTVFIITIIALITTSIATAQTDYLSTGKQYYDRGQYSQAIKTWQQIIKEDKDIENRILSYNY